MKKAKKLISSILLLVLLTGICTSCRNDPVSKTGGKIQLSVGSWPVREGKDMESKKRCKEYFEATYPNMEIIPDTWSFDLQTFYPKAEAGLLPNVFSTYYTEISKLIDGGYAADLTDALKANGLEGKFKKKTIDVVSRDGKIYAFPWTANLLGLAYNTELFKAAGLLGEDGTPMQPKDWYEVVEFAIKIKEKTGKPGFVFPTANNNGGWLFMVLAWSFGVDFMEQQADGKWKATFNTDEAIQALEYIKDLKWKYDVLPSNTLIDLDEYYKTYAGGNAGMLIGGGDISNKVVKYDMNPEHIGIMAMPRGPKRHVTLLGGMIDVVSSNVDKEQIDAAIKWFKVLGRGDELTDSIKEGIDNEIAAKKDRGELIGIKSMHPLIDGAESVNYRYSVIEQNANANPNHVRLYNEFVNNPNVEIQPEEPVCAQDLYGVLDNCIQEVLINKDADCAALIQKANSDFQTNYLDNLVY